MKNIKIQYFVFTVLIFFVIKQLFDDRIISNIIQSIVFAILFCSAKGLYLRKTQKKIAEVDNYQGQKVISNCLMNHVRGIISDGGAGYLLQDKLVFVPHKLNLSHRNLSISFSEVETVVSYKIWGIFDTGLKIVLKAGKTEKFVVDKTSQFYRDLVYAIRNSAV